MYVTKVILGSLKHDILAGLVSGRYQRYGGVIRVAAGHAHAGSIVTMLRELPHTRAAADLIGHVAEFGQAVTKQIDLPKILQLTQVASAAGIVNLGISAAGFAIMAYKLQRLQTSVNQLMQATQDISTRLDQVGAQLVELKLLATRNNELAHAAIDEVCEARNDLLDEHAAWMLAKLEALPVTGPIADVVLASARERFAVTRRWLASTIDRATDLSEASSHWLDVLTRFRLWCFATASEVQLARRASELKRATEIARDAAECARGWATRWSQALVPPDQLGGIHRFEHHQFAALHDESIVRLRRLQADSRSRSAAIDVAHAASALGPAWFTQQLAIGRTLDFVAESVERVEGLAAETAWCHAHGLGPARWEDLTATDVDHALAAIDVRELS